MGHHGITLDRHEVGGFQVYDVLYRAGTRLRDHVHERPGLTGVIEGALAEAGVCDSTVLPGGGLLRPAGCRHENRFDPGDARCLVVEIPEERWRPLAPLLPRPDAPFVASRPELGRLQRRVLSRLHGDGLAGSYLLEAALLELLGLVGACLGAQRETTWVAAAAEHMEGDPTATPEDLARTAGSSVSELDRAFRRQRGASLLRYRMERRVERARRLLLESSLPICHVALETGFCDQAHLTNAFRQVHGSSPGRYRRLHRR